MSLKRNAQIAVVGSGISSLTYTFFLSKLRPDISFTVYESSHRPSGYINTEFHNINNEKILLEKGPRTLRGTSDGTVLMIDTLLKLGYSNDVKVVPKDSEANKKWLLSKEDKLVEVPSDLSTLRTFLSSSLGKGLVLDVIKEPFSSKKHNQDDETVHEFISRRFGPNLSNNVLSAVFHGIYGGDVKKLSAHTIIKSMVDMERSHGSIIKSVFSKMFKSKEPKTLSKDLQIYQELFNSEKLQDLQNLLKKYPMIVFQNGLQTFTSAIYDSLISNPKVEFKFNTPVFSIMKNSDSITLNNDESFDFVRTTINSNQFARLIPGTKTSVIASDLSFVDIFLMNVYIPNAELPLHGFGFLVPQSNQNKEELLGVIFDSDIEKYSRPLLGSSETVIPTSKTKDTDYVKVTLMFGGHYWSHKPIPAVSELIDYTNHVLKRDLKLDVKEQDVYIDHKLIKQCIPQFHVGYNDLFKNFHNTLEEEFDGLISHGGMSFGDGCGVPDVVMNSFRNALKCK